MNRITSLMQTRGARKLLVPFLTVGYPTLKVSLQLVMAAIDSGADIVELGMPFSDPLADGPQIQLSSQRALQNGITLPAVLEAVQAIRRQSQIPLVLMGYFNPVLKYSVKRFLADSHAAGVDGLIIPDLPIEESNGYLANMQEFTLSSIFLVAPTSSKPRIKAIERNCSDFVYAVTVTGVTGAGRQFDRSTDQYLGMLQTQLRKPFVAGFGVSSPESARRLTKYADGVVIGSHLISLIQEAQSDKRSAAQVAAFLRGIRRELDRQ